MKMNKPFHFIDEIYLFLTWIFSTLSTKKSLPLSLSDLSSCPGTSLYLQEEEPLSSLHTTPPSSSRSVKVKISEKTSPYRPTDLDLWSWWTEWAGSNCRLRATDRGTAEWGWTGLPAPTSQSSTPSGPSSPATPPPRTGRRPASRSSCQCWAWEEILVMFPCEV